MPHLRHINEAANTPDKAYYVPLRHHKETVPHQILPKTAQSITATYSRSDTATDRRLPSLMEHLTIHQ